jgi:regulator of CtrA degradation
MNAPTEFNAVLIDALYRESIRLADAARRYFDWEGAADREALDPVERVAFACESLKVTTRLMHVVSWLLVRKAVAAGELRGDEGAADERRLGRAAADAPPPGMPVRAMTIIEESRDLYARVARLDRRFDGDGDGEAALTGARGLLDRLQAAL